MRTNVEWNIKKLKEYDIKEININKFLIDKYVDYPRKECYIFIMESMIIWKMVIFQKKYAHIIN